jgi:hypothetical protein
MLKRLIYFQFLLILLASCEEYYTPKIDDVSGHLVVDALITNDLSKNYVRLSTTRGFYDEQEPSEILDATVELVDKNGFIFEGTENGAGSFIFKAVPKIGNSYKLRIIYQSITYESEMVTMPSLPEILNASLVEKVKKEYFSDIYGVVTPTSFPGNDICIDAPVTDSLSNYRFSTRSILEWVYTPKPPYQNGAFMKEILGWNSFYPTNFNIAGPKSFSQASVKIEKHAIEWLANESKYYLHADTLVSVGWILIVDQYGTSKGSFDYHEKLNSQFAADGSLFDPIPDQIHGNIKCVSDSSKIVFGYFDLNSYRQYRYFLKMDIKYNGDSLIQLLTYPYIVDFGRTDQQSLPPYWWIW